MTFETESSIDINAPVETVYKYLADFPRHGQWSTGVAEIVPLNNGPVTVGKEFEAYEEVPAKMTTCMRITALQPPKHIAWEGWDGRMMHVQWSFELSPQAEGTHLVQSARFEPQNFIAKLLMTLLRKRQIPQENAQSLQRIKANLEKVNL